MLEWHVPTTMCAFLKWTALGDVSTYIILTKVALFGFVDEGRGFRPIPLFYPGGFEYRIQSAGFAFLGLVMVCREMFAGNRRIPFRMSGEISSGGVTSVFTEFLCSSLYFIVFLDLH